VDYSRSRHAGDVSTFLLCFSDFLWSRVVNDEGQMLNDEGMKENDQARGKAKESSSRAVPILKVESKDHCRKSFIIWISSFRPFALVAPLNF
jgi:hypothetical protein